MAVLHSLQTIIIFLVVLSILVVAHEWGHFIVARLFGIRVDDFSIGFGKRLVRLGKRGDTEYNIRMLPLGGFVRIAGMEPDEAPLIQAKDKLTQKDQPDDPDAGQIPLLAENTAEPEPYTAPDGFNAKPLWQRSLVILAGPVMSFILGYLILCLMGVTIGLPMGKMLNKIGEVLPGGVGQQIGLHAGDEIVSINGQPTPDGNRMVDFIRNGLGKPITLVIRRGNSQFTKVAVPRPLLDENNKPQILVFVTSPGALGPALGLQAGENIDQINNTVVTGAAQGLAVLRADAGQTVDIIAERGITLVPLHGTVPKLTPATMPQLNAHEVGALDIAPMAGTERTSFRQSIHMGNRFIVGMFTNIAHMVKQGKLQKQVGGVVVMYRATQIAVENGLVQVVLLAAEISISLAIFNLLPIPILDGGHLLNFFIEWVRGGKKMSEEWQQRFMLSGLAIIGTLFIWIMFKNILQVITHQLPQ